MNFRRQPFQFTSIDPAKRHAELQKRFGLPSEEMHVDFANPGAMGAREESLKTGSPRLQHRVPMFSQDIYSTKTTGIQNNVDNGHQPRVRVIPIQVEGVDDTSRRHRTFSGPTGTVKNIIGEKSPEHRINSQPKPVDSVAKKPHVCNIPIKIETKNNKSDEKEPRSKETVIPTVIEQNTKSHEKSSNGCVSKNRESFASDSLKQIEGVLNKLKGYQEEVECFVGTTKDKQYRYLDEMLTRCMLDLDNVDTLGLDSVRQSRKNAVKKVQACIDLLDTKVTTQLNIAETSGSVSLSKIDPNIANAEKSQLNEGESAMETDTGVKDHKEVSENEDVVIEEENIWKDSVASSEPSQACDIDMEDSSLESQCVKIVVEKPDKDLIEVKTTVEIEDTFLEDTVASSELSKVCDVEMEEKSSEDNSERIVVEELEPDKDLTEVKTLVKLEDIPLEKAVAFSELAQVYDVEMEDNSLDGQNTKIVIEEVEEPDKNVTEVKSTVKIEDASSENKNLETVKNISKNGECSNGNKIVIEEIDDSEKKSSELDIKEICSSVELSPVQENTVPSKVNEELVITEIDSCKCLEVSRDNNKPNVLISGHSNSSNKQIIVTEVL